MYSYTRLGDDHGVLVVDFNDDEMLARLLRIASASVYTRATAFPGVSADVPPAVIEEVTSLIEPLVQRYFGKVIRAGKGFRGGFLGMACPWDDGRGPTRAAWAPHIDGIGSRIVAVHYLSDDRVTWPFGGGTAFFKHRETGHLDLTREKCNKEMNSRPETEYAWLCRDFMGHFNPLMVSDPNKTPIGVTDDYGEYDLVHKVDYKANRIVLYASDLLHSAFITEEGERNLNCDPSATHHRTAVSYHWS